MRCLKPVRITKNLDIIKFPYGLEIPCGQCMNCRIQKREEWCMRILHESESWGDKLLFLTLTYDDAHLPENSSLKKSDLQKFIKRLRKRLNRPLKYFACGEYGEESGRPHYHCLIFGIDYLDLVDRMIIKDCWKMCDWSMLGTKPFGDVNRSSIRYTVSYIEKEITGEFQKYAYEKVEIPFRLVSKGIGRKFAERNKENFEKQKTISINGIKRAIPRYYTDVTGIERTILQEYAQENELNVVDSIIGDRISRDDLYLTKSKEEVIRVDDAIRESNIQHDRNLKARIEINSRRKSTKL